MDPRRLRLLLELSRRGSMRAVADELGYTTSTISQQLAVLAREAGTPLVEPAGRMVRLTPAGQRLADHAVTILAALDAARAALDPAAEPAGVVRVAGFATAIRRSLVPVVAALAETHPAVELQVREHEPPEALALLADDEIDLALVYDFNLAPRAFGREVHATPLWTARWDLAVPAGDDPAGTDAAPDVLRRYADADWIVNSRDTSDETVLLAIAALAGFAPRFTHRADSLELVEDLIDASLGVGLLPAGAPIRAGLQLLELRDPEAVLRSYAVTRRGREAWAPLALVARSIGGHDVRGAGPVAPARPDRAPRSRRISDRPRR
jgi:DNA-binding transcriptional LysR family regulator